jgi:hypothetical protein
MQASIVLGVFGGVCLNIIFENLFIYILLTVVQSERYFHFNTHIFQSNLTVE